MLLLHCILDIYKFQNFEEEWGSNSIISHWKHYESKSWSKTAANEDHVLVY